jgi:hypothetical protein
MSILTEVAPLNLLLAYPYLKAPALEALRQAGSRVRFLLDSGAFTAWKSGSPIALDDYCRFLERLPVTPWRYFTLDVIGDPKASLANYEIMRRRGFKPMPIFTRGDEPDILEYYYSTSDVVGIGSGVGTPKRRGFINGVMTLAKGRRVHWLGFTDVDYLKYYRPYMADSSTWATALQYAVLKLYDRNGRSFKVSKQDFARRPSPDVRRILDTYEISPSVLAVKGNWKNSGSGKYPIEWATLRSSVRCQLDVGRALDTHLFMAVTSDMQIRLALDAYDFWQAREPSLLQRAA